MLAALISIFALSFTFRTLPAIMTGQIKADFDVSDQEVGLFAAAFNLSFAACQLLIGIAFDRYGPRRTLGIVFLVAIVGGAMSALAPSFPILVLGQLLIGVGCSPGLIAVLLFIDRRYPKDRFGRVSGWVMSLGALGMLLSGTPLAWVVQESSWRFGFAIVTAAAAVAWLAVWLLVDDRSCGRNEERETVAASFRELGRLLADKRIIGVLALAAATYPAFMTLRGLWIVPLLAERHAFSLVASGHVLTAVSLAVLCGPIAFGRLDPGGDRRRRRIVGCTFLYAALLALVAMSSSAPFDIALLILSSFFSGYIVMQYADVRVAYPPQTAGRALAIFTTAMFLGVAGMQLITGFAASTAPLYGIDAITAVLITIAGLLVSGATAYARLPKRDEYIPATAGASSMNERAT